MSFLSCLPAAPGVGALLNAPVRVAETAVGAPLRASAALAGLATGVVGGATDAARAAAGAALEAIGGTPVRRVSRTRNAHHGDDYWIEVRGLDLAHDALTRELRRTLGAVPGVGDVVVNGPLSRVIVSLNRPAAQAPSADTLCDAVAAAETAVAQSVDGVGVPVAQPIPMPGDTARLPSSILGTAVAGTAAVGALAGAVLPTRGLSRLLAVPGAVADFHPGIRAMVNERIGTQGADLLLRSTNSVASILTGSPLGAAVSTGLGTLEILDARRSRSAWDRLGPRLTDRARRTGTVPPPPDAGPRGAADYARGYERLSANAGLSAAGVIGLTGNGRQAAEAMLVGLPKAARTVRDSFATTLGRGLTEQHEALLMNPRALRGLAEIDTLLVDPRALFTPRLRIARVTGVDAADRSDVWHRAESALAAGRLDRGWNTVDTAAGSARILVSPIHEPLAPPLLMEARHSGLRVYSLADDAYGSLHQAFDDLFPTDGDVDASLARVARSLADDGHTVALLTRGGTRAPAAVTLSIGLFDDDRSAPDPSWNADLLVPDLSAVWRLVHAVPEAIQAAERGMSLAVGGSALGTLMLIPEVPGNGPGLVNTHALLGLRSGRAIARRALEAPVPPGEADYDWYAMPISEVARRLPPPDRPEPQPSSGLQAVAGTTAAVPLKALRRTRNYLRDFSDTMREDLNDPITPILTTGAAASALLGSPLDAAIVGGVLALNTGLSAQQSLHAKRLLRQMLAEQDPLARRLSGISDHTEYEEIRASRLLPGDIIEVRSGEVIPADARIVDADNAEVDESSLTGESLPVAKDTADTPGAPLAERTGMLYAGTTMVAGKARGIVTAVGEATQTSRALAMSPRAAKDVGLAAQLGDITRRALPWSFAGGGLIGLLSLIRRRPIREVASGAVSIAVAAVPEGLPLVVTLAQSASARRLTGSAVLVRNSRAIEAFARLDAVCFDKTGTLSENRLRVHTVLGLAGNDEKTVLTAAGETMLVRRDGSVEHATDAAIHTAAGEAGISFVRPDVLLPFQSDRPYAAALIGRRLMVKGAPEALMAALKPEQQALLQDALDQLAARGLRVLAVADREITARQAEAAAADSAALERPSSAGLRLLGVVGMSDTPRPAARPLIAELLERELEVRMITGDHPVTAAAIATEMGLAVTADEVMTGDRWSGFTSAERIEAARTHVVFARMSPEHKVQVVQALSDAGLVTAMVGDGANDAAAIRAADVGIGVASSGSDPARTAADVMLLDGDIAGIIDALDEGEQLWRRVLSAISVLLGHSVGELGFGLISTLVTGKPALSARQMMLVNMLTDALPAAALAVSPQRDPEVDGAHDASTIYRAVAVRAVFTTLGATLAWAMAMTTGRRSRAATVGLVGLVASQMLEMLIDSNGPLVIATNLGTFAVMGMIVSVPGLSHLFGCTPIGPVGWAQAMTGAAVAAGIAKVLPDVIDRLADSIPDFTEQLAADLPELAALLGVPGAAVPEESVVDDEDAGADQDGVDVLDRGSEQPGPGLDESVGTEGASESRHG